MVVLIDHEARRTIDASLDLINSRLRDISGVSDQICNETHNPANLAVKVANIEATLQYVAEKLAAVSNDFTTIEADPEDIASLPLLTIAEMRGDECPRQTKRGLLR